MEIAIVIVNLILLFYFTRMAIHSRQVQVAGSWDRRGSLPCSLSESELSGCFRIIRHSQSSRPVLIVLLGVLCSQMRSGLQRSGDRSVG